MENYVEGRKKALEFGRAIHNNMLESVAATNALEIMRLVKVGYTREEAQERLRIEALTTMENNGYGTSKRCYTSAQHSGDLQRKPIMGDRYMAC
ncbi:MAG: hypothetical protein IJ564_00960 [Alphaproteobacteria bacterium]|nr:hypothetical protein [Alphaproteobacteria bacterium]